MDFFRGSSSPLRGSASPVRSRASSVNSHRTSPDDGEDDDPGEISPNSSSATRNHFSYYFMLRTGKFLDPNIADQTRKFILRVRKSEEEIEVKSKEVQLFYTYMTKKLLNFPYFEGWKPDTINDIVVGMERFVMVNIFENVFTKVVLSFFLST